MKQKLLTYKGYLNNLYCFSDDAGKKISFKKSRKELIESYDLTNKTNVNKIFLVSYFVVSESDTFILSDMVLKEEITEE
jgi:hypothetical protein